MTFSLIVFTMLLAISQFLQKDSPQKRVIIKKRTHKKVYSR
jgi:hypothetical protein